ncbi:mucin-binding protein, partial [Paucilactobacillus suebicus]
QSYNGVATADLPVNETVTVTYTAGEQSVTIEYVDDQADEAVVGSNRVQTGATNGTTNWDSSTIPTGYVLSPTQAASGTYKFTADDNQVVQIHLTHHVTDSTTTSTQEINYVILDKDGNVSIDQSKAPANNLQTLTWKVVTDDVTGTSYATALPTGYPAVTSPTVNGYTPSQSSVPYSYPTPVATADIENTNITVNYTPQGNTVNVTYVDDVTGATVKTDTIDGVTDETGTYTADLSGINSGYRLAQGQSSTVDYIITAPSVAGRALFARSAEPVNDSDNIVIHLTHHLTNSTTTSDQAINYVILDKDGNVSSDQSKAPATDTETLTWKVVTDDVTGESYATAEASGYPAVTSPTLDGYTPSKDEVAYSYPTPTATDNVKNTDVTVNYTPDAETATVTYVDDVTGETVKTDTINGVTDESGTYTADLSVINSGYRLAEGESATQDYTITTDGSDNLTVHLTHHLTNSTTTSTQTVHYVILNGDGSAADSQTKAPADNSQTLTWKVVTDDVTGTSYATAEAAGYAAVTSPEIDGYTPDQATIAATYPAPSATADVKNTEQTVKYAPDASTTTVTYIDDAAGNVVKTDTIDGVTDETGTYAVDLSDVNAGYRLASSQSKDVNYTVAPDNSGNITVHLTHSIVDGTATTTRTITYVITDGDSAKTPKTVTQTMNWKTVTDEVTGTSYATAQNSYAAVESPVIAGYTADKLSVAQLSEGNVPTSELADTNVNDTVTYTADEQTVTISYVDTQTGKTVKTATVTGKTDSALTIPDLPGYTVDRTGLPTSFVAGLTQVNVPVTAIASNEPSGNNGGTTNNSTTGNNTGSQTSTSKSASANSLTAKGNGTANVKASPKTNTTADQNKLPQTSDDKDQAAAVTILGLMTGMFGLIGLKRRKRDED